MKLLLLMAEADHFDRWESASEEQQRAFFDGLEAFASAVRERGALLGGEALARPDRALTVRDGVTTQGPYAETTEQLGGFYLVDLPSVEEAAELARLLPVPSVEVRPVVEVEM